MKLFITKSEYEALPDVLKESYTQEGENYRLVVEDDKGDLYGKLKNADKLLEEKKREEQRRKELEEALKQYEAKQKEEELKKLEEQGKYEELLKRLEAEKEAKIQELQQKAEAEAQARKEMLLNLKVKEIATALAGERAALLEPHLRNRLDIRDDKVIILDSTGVPNPNMTDDKLIDEFKTNPLFAPVIKGRDSTGGGTVGANGNTAGGDWEQYFDRSSPNYSIMKQIDLEKENPALYAQLIKKFGLDDI